MTGLEAGRHESPCQGLGWHCCGALRSAAATLAGLFGVWFNTEGLPGVHETMLAFCLSLAVYVVRSRMTPRHLPPEGHVTRAFGD